MKRNLLVLLTFLLLFSFSGYAELVDMRAAGADATGKKLNTELINSTITRLNANGGGTLFFPAGTYLTGGITLKSNITIDLEAGATLLFSDNFDDYLPFVKMRHEGIVMNSFHPLIYAYEAENITIKGEGTLNGQGQKWWKELYKVQDDLKLHGVRNVNKYQPMWDNANDVKKLYAETNKDYVTSMQRRFFRPPFIQPFKCTNVRIEGVKIINSPFWTVNPEFCENVTVDGVTIHNPLSPNTDGINPESCKYVHISNCHISVGDDCITLKSGRDLQARELNAPDEDITITNCTMLAGHGGVVIGSEMSGGVKRVTISNCVFDGTDRGIRIKSTRGRGGVVEDIQVDNIVMRNIQQEAIVLNMRYSNMPYEPLSDRTPIFRNININNVTASDVKVPIKINGLKEAPISDITMTNVNIRNSKEESSFIDCRNIKLRDVYVNGKKLEFPAK